MKKVLITSALALSLATGLVANEPSHQSSTAATDAAATATDKLAAEKSTAYNATTVVSTDHTDAAHHDAAKTAVVVKKSSKGAHHHRSRINIKEADEVTTRLNAMPCPVTAPATSAIPVA